jgi:type I restriction enzyme S subunit
MISSTESLQPLVDESRCNALPEGWAWASIREVTKDVPNCKPEAEPNKDFGYVDISSICNQSYRITEVQHFLGRNAPSRARRPIQASDVLFSNVRTYLRNVAMVPNNIEAQLCSTGFTVLRPNDAIDPQLLLHEVLTDRFIDLVTPQQTGSQYPATSDRVVMAATVPLPPMSEQKRIVARLQDCLARVNSSRDQLSRVPAIIKRFRQAVLAAACSGSLTEDWRDKHNDLQTPESTDDVSEIPVGWQESSVQAVCRAIIDCPHSTPKWSPTGIVCLRTSNFKVGFLDLSDVRYVSEEIYVLRTSRLEPQPGDVLYSREGTLGVTCLVPPELKLCLGQRMMLMRVESDICNPRFLMWVLNSPQMMSIVGELTRGSTAPHVNVGDVKAFSIPLPSVQEQDEIVRRVDALFALAAKVENRMKTIRVKVNKLTQSILAKAFRGELVPTEAELARREGRDYEPASVLLERIRAEKTDQVKPQRVPRHRLRNSSVHV